MSAPAMIETKPLVRRFAERFGVDADKLLTTLKATCFKVKDGEATNEQMQALLIVADQYRLNPFTREIFAFPDKQNGIVPVVSVDGWARIINEHPQFDGIEFRYSDERVPARALDGLKVDAHAWIECVIFRKDRAHPTTIREFLAEVYRKPFKKGDFVAEGPWQTHTNRFHRHKALIQCARVAFGFAGIYDEDEAERIVEAHVVESGPPRQFQAPSRPPKPPYPQESFDKNFAAWKALVESGTKSTKDIISTIESKATLTKEQREEIELISAPTAAENPADDADWEKAAFGMEDAQ